MGIDALVRHSEVSRREGERAGWLVVEPPAGWYDRRKEKKSYISIKLQLCAVPFALALPLACLFFCC
jgi:hypothetical protein